MYYTFKIYFYKLLNLFVSLSRNYILEFHKKWMKLRRNSNRKILLYNTSRPSSLVLNIRIKLYLITININHPTVPKTVSKIIMCLWNNRKDNNKRWLKNFTRSRSTGHTVPPLNPTWSRFKNRRVVKTSNIAKWEKKRLPLLHRKR